MAEMMACRFGSCVIKDVVLSLLISLKSVILWEAGYHVIVTLKALMEWSTWRETEAFCQQLYE